MTTETDEWEMKQTARGCHNCVHRFGLYRDTWCCSRTGTRADHEMRAGGKCSQGQTLALWAPRPGMLERLGRMLVGPA